MIEVKQLRIGSLVMDRGGKALRIDWMERDKVCQKMMLHGQEVHPLTEHFEYLQPIPLTEAWLEKLPFVQERKIGMRKILKHINFDRLNIELCANNEVAIYVHDNLIGFKSNIHELQLLFFALTGQELTVKED